MSIHGALEPQLEGGLSAPLRHNRLLVSSEHSSQVLPQFICNITSKRRLVAVVGQVLVVFRCAPFNSKDEG